MPVKLVEADVEKDIPIFTTLLNNNRLNPVHPERFHWLYLDNPAGKARAWYIQDEATKEAVAFTCVLPRRVRVAGRELICWNCGDFSVNQKYRTLGVALKLRRAAKNAVDNNEIPGFYAHPNDRMKVIHGKVGHHCIGKMQRFVRILKSDSYVRQYVGNELIAEGLSFLANIALSSRDALSLLKPSSFELQHLADVSFSKEYDSLYDELSKEFTIVADRRSSYLNWRYLRNPLYHCERIELRQQNKLKGHLIYNIEDNVAHIKDVFCKPIYGMVEVLVNGLIRQLRKTSVQSISAVFMDSNPLINHLKRLGFKIRPDESSVFAYANENSDICSHWINGKSWFMTVGDRDV